MHHNFINVKLSSKLSNQLNADFHVATYFTVRTSMTALLLSTAARVRVSGFWLGSAKFKEAAAAKKTDNKQAPF